MNGNLSILRFSMISITTLSLTRVADRSRRLAILTLSCVAERLWRENRVIFDHQNGT